LTTPIVKHMPPRSNDRPSASQRWILAPIIILILLVGFALRTAQLSRQPLWWDEGLNAHYVHYGLSGFVEEVRATHDTNPPAHRLALKGWSDLAGTSPFTLRYLSAYFDVVSIALTWTIGRRLINRRAALLATWFVALSPLHVYHAREAKGYTFAAAFSLLAVYLWGKKLKYASANTPRAIPAWNCYGLGYALSVALSVGAHYYQILAVVWQGLWTGSRLAWRVVHRGRYRQELVLTARWIAAAGAGALLILPWVLLTFDTAFQGAANVSHQPPLSLFACIGQIIQALSAGPILYNTWPVLALILGGLAALGGLIARSRRSEPLFMSTWFGVPLLLAYLLQSRFSFFSPRFLLYLGAPYYLLVAQGIVTLERCLNRRFPLRPNLLSIGRGSIILLAIGVTGLWMNDLTRLYTRPINQNEDFRPAIVHLRNLSKPGDALAYNYIWQAGYVMSYYPGNDLTLYRTHYDPDEAASALSAIFEKHPRLWLLNYRIASQDQDNLPAAWLEAHAYKLKGQWYGYHQLTLYLAPDAHLPGIGPIENTATFERGVKLTYPAIDVESQPGDVLPLPLRWQALELLERDYHVFVHLGHPNAPPLAQNDGPPHNGLAPTTTWSIGEEVIDRRALLIPQAISPGRYALMVGLYDKSTGERLSLDDAGPGVDKSEERLLLGYVTVSPPAE